MKSTKQHAIVLIGLVLAVLPLLSAAQDCGNHSGFSKPWTLDSAVLFTSKVLNIDADGSPNSYLVDGNGLSCTCDGVLALENGKKVTPESDPKNWQQKCNSAWSLAKKTNDYRRVAIFGFMTDSNNRPLLQGAGDPLPGKAYISATSVGIPDSPDYTQRHYVDAAKVPYVVLSASFVSKYKVKPGSIVIVYRKKTNTYAFAVFADNGSLGEASVKLHQNLGSKPIVRIKGVERAKARIEDPTLVVVFPSKIASPIADTDVWNKAINLAGTAALQEFGGIAQLQLCAK